MGDDDGRLENLRELTTVVSRTYDGVDPGTLLRTLERRLESGEGPLESVTVEELSLEGDDVHGTLVAVADRREAGAGTITYRPYGPHGAMTIILGLLFALPSLFITVLLSFFGMYLYAKEDEAELPLRSQTEIRAFLTEDDGATTVTYAGETFLTVDTDRLETYDLAHRTAIVAEVTDWHSLAVTGESHYENFDDVFFGQHIDAWWNRNAGADVTTVSDLEAEIAERFSWRTEYTDSILEVAPESVADSREDERATLDLEALAVDIDRQIEREGTNA
ncbi:hypothetical protein ACYJ1Y_09615 [Natrialbaceae archaeon A-gly3]